MAHLTKSQRQLHAFILSMVWNAAAADDVLQESNLVLWEKVAEFDGNRPFLSLGDEVHAVAGVGLAQTTQRQRLVFDDDLAKLLADEAAMAEPVFDARRVALASCFQKLRPEQRELIARRYEPEASVNAMAEAAGTTAKAISDRLRRIRNALPECIEKKQSRTGAFA